MKIFIEKLKIFIEKLKIFIEKLKIFIEKLKIFVEKLKIVVEKLKIVIEKMKIFIEKLKIFIKKIENFYWKIEIFYFFYFLLKNWTFLLKNWTFLLKNWTFLLKNWRNFFEFFFTLFIEKSSFLRLASHFFIIFLIFSAVYLVQDDRVGSMNYSYRMAMQYVEQRKFRDTVLEELVRLYQEDSHRPDYVNMCQCLIHLDRPSQITAILDSLVKNDNLKTSLLVSWFVRRGFS